MGHAAGAKLLSDRLHALSSRLLERDDPDALELANLAAALGIEAYGYHARVDWLARQEDMHARLRRLEDLEGRYRAILGLLAASWLVLGALVAAHAFGG